jgi:hypothetical protein
MFWPFKRKEPKNPPAPETSADTGMYDRAAQNLIEQGVDPAKVARATALIKKYAQDGVLPDGIVKPPDE